ncbi:glycosyl transferase family 1 [Marinobacter halophilus]|uniref:Glycosyl transferase family 1 n=2 Tax=Marinobacter halophilus TaxID=1323740 RepID=A0A2T1KD63_9GAMM|nr:glycosyltransferase [Marinobacter halophilus]PSF08084.1 glycosyl transferase family 1 [Marinobacter halophilus]
MRVLHVITSLDSGGAEGVLARLCRADHSNAHHVISLMDEGVYGLPLRRAGVQVYCAGMPRGKVTVKGLFRLWLFIREARPDVIQTWMYHADFLGGLLGRLAGVRSIVWGIRNTDLEPGKSSRSTILVAKLCARISSWLPARIAVCAEKAAEVHARLGYCTGKMTVIPNGYDLARFKPLPSSAEVIRHEFQIPASDVLIGMVARFDPYKDHGNLISALEQLDERGVEFRCLLVGEGMDSGNSKLMKFIEDAGLEKRIILAGRRADIPVVMSALDLHVLSSLSEAFPNVIAEAMACGTPCVSTDVGDASLIVGDTGWIVPPGNSDKLAAAVQKAINEILDADEWGSRKAAARTRIENRFSLKGMITSFDSLWQAVLR